MDHPRIKKDPPLELIDAGRELLSTPDFSIRDNMYDHDLDTIANVCLKGAEGRDTARTLCDQIKQGFLDHTFRTYSVEQFLQSIFELQPKIALDVFFGSARNTAGSGHFVDQFFRFPSYRGNPLDGVPIDVMLNWCDTEPDRYQAVSRAVSFQAGAKWTPLAMEMLKRAPDPLAILKMFVQRFSPGGWSGSLADILETRMGLLDQLQELGNRSLEQYAAEIRPQLVDQIAQRRRLEDERDSARGERFE